MALAWVLVAVLSIALPLGFIVVLLRLVNRVPSRARRALAVRLPGASGLRMGLEAGLESGLETGVDGGFGARLDSELDVAGLGQDTAIRGPGRAPGRHMP